MPRQLCSKSESCARSGKLFCDNCKFDPKTKIGDTAVKARSLLDVHHMNPLEEATRYTTETDFCLACPNCHRFMHRLARAPLATLAKKQKPYGLPGI